MKGGIKQDDRIRTKDKSPTDKTWHHNQNENSTKAKIK